MTHKKTIFVVAVALLAGGCATVPEPAPPLGQPHVWSFSESPLGAKVPRGWYPWQLSQFKKSTDYEIVEEDDRKVVKASADSSASGLKHPLNFDPREFPMLSWEWKVDALILGADNTRKGADDSPVRMLVTFGSNGRSLPFDEQIFAVNFRIFTGQPLPYATLAYIWDNQARENAVIPSRHTSRIQLIVVRSGRAGLGAWQRITRNVVEDYRRAFGEEPGQITAVAIASDTDNTDEKAIAYYGDIRFRRNEPSQKISSTP
jgi:hypothetical protein